MLLVALACTMLSALFRNTPFLPWTFPTAQFLCLLLLPTLSCLFPSFRSAAPAPEASTVPAAPPKLALPGYVPLGTFVRKTPARLHPAFLVLFWPPLATGTPCHVASAPLAQLLRHFSLLAQCVLWESTLNLHKPLALIAQQAALDQQVAEIRPKAALSAPLARLGL